MTSRSELAYDISLHCRILFVLIAMSCMAPHLAFAQTSEVEAQSSLRCADYDPQRNVYWGDLHIHTSYSMDAYMFDTRLTPEDAYRFARGETRMLPPLDENDRG